MDNGRENGKYYNGSGTVLYIMSILGTGNVSNYAIRAWRCAPAA